ncbi:unnamed protein product [Linum tenue]|uniref:ABC transmembrane type-1 domain-containing protein n=1 Tax=Linum tenue TaxID=586396 RepID=A0AAV0JMM0_9ROSI|nr:unnamed protein product [Linum tenue]
MGALIHATKDGDWNRMAVVSKLRQLMTEIEDEFEEEEEDMAFFDSEKVGGLTSRLRAECQQLSNVIGNNIHLIVRSTFQEGVGALINLLILSWPLASSSLITCLVLATIFLLYGRYQEEAAKLTQDLGASAGKAAEETLSSIRTIRVCGTEWEELGMQ